MASVASVDCFLAQHRLTRLTRLDEDAETLTADASSEQPAAEDECPCF
jgi:hypothetical protein